jgi:hypothetical protein
MLDGKPRTREAQLNEKDSFNDIILLLRSETLFFCKAKRPVVGGCQLPDKHYIACSYKDYLLASSNEIPERWLRAQERS